MCIKVYKIYIRPILEYGLGIAILPKGAITKLQKIQVVAFRTILWTARSTSSDAMHLFLGLERMAFRNHTLHAKYIDSINNGPKKLHPIGHLLQHNIQHYDNLRAKQFGRGFMKKGLLRESIITTGRSPSEADYTKSRVSHLLEIQLRSSDSSVKLLSPHPSGNPDILATPGSYLSRNDSYIVSQWKLGRFNPRRTKKDKSDVLCKRCGSVITRNHMLLCAPDTMDALQALNTSRGHVLATPLPLPLENSVMLLMKDLSPVDPNHVALLQQLVQILVKARAATDPVWIQPLITRYWDDEDPNEMLNKLLAIQRRQHRRQ